MKRIALTTLCVLLWAGAAHAQAPAEEAPTQTMETPIPQEVTAAEAPAEDVVVREPDATAIIEVRRLTPVLPEVAPPEGPSNAYQLYWEIDIPVLIGGLALAAARIWRSSSNSQRAQCLIVEDPETHELVSLDQCDPDDLNAFDRLVAGRYDLMWGRVSDYALLGVAFAPIPLLWADEGFLPMVNDMVVVYQAGLLAVAFSGMATLTGGRARPFVYGQEAPVDVRTGGNGGLSFISSHTSFSFAVATATFWTLERRRGLDGLTAAVGLIGEGAAALVALARVLAGRHFPTDVMMGALVGMGMGTLVPTLHGSPVRVTGSAGKDHAAASLEVAF